VPAQALLALGQGLHEAGTVRLRGFISAPGVDRGDRRQQFLFVNGRLLRSTLLAGAWSAGYATFALSRRQPFGVLFVDLPPDHVDPNVHPTKSDVRLRHPEAVHDAVRRAIVGTLTRDANARVRGALSLAPPLDGGTTAESFGDVPGESVAGAGTQRFPWDGDASSTQDGDASHTRAQLVAVASPPALRILAQLDGTFVLATDGSALVLVDQHAAHERVAYELIAGRARAGAPVSEPLLIPYTVEFDASDAERFEASLEALAEAGLEAEPFGERSYRIVATPAGYGARAFDLRAYVADLGDEVPGLNARERVWASLACHSVARAGEPLEVAEMSALLERLVRCENPMHCPHGRPTIVRIEADAVARMFKRL